MGNKTLNFQRIKIFETCQLNSDETDYKTIEYVVGSLEVDLFIKSKISSITVEFIIESPLITIIYLDEQKEKTKVTHFGKHIIGFQGELI